jgi:hypothetical protein
MDASGRSGSNSQPDRCEWKEQPADLTAIDNPMGLMTAPNFYTAMLFLTRGRWELAAGEGGSCAE